MILGHVKRNILALTIANLCIGLVEFFFGLYLSRVLGPEGLGLLHLVTPINCLFLSFMTEGLVTTTSKISARLYAAGDPRQMAQSVKISTCFSFLWSLVLVGLLLLSARPIADIFLGEPSLYFPILSTCPLMLLMSISNIIKGHFLGLAKIKIPALINVTEKILRFPILYMLIRFCFNQWPVPSITFVYLCYALGEIHSVFWLIVYYRWLQKWLKKAFPSQNEKSRPKPIRKILKPLIGGALPICSTQCLLELVNAFSSVIVKSRLCDVGYTSSEALSLLGKYKGMVFPLLSYPMILIGSICSIAVPKVSTLLATHQKKAAARLMRRCLLAAVAIGCITALFFWVCGDWLSYTLYKRTDLSGMIRLAGLCAPLLDLAAISSSLLISVGLEAQSFRNSLMQQLLLLILLILLVGNPSLHIYGYIIAFGISNLLLVVINLHALKAHLFVDKSSPYFHI